MKNELDESEKEKKAAKTLTEMTCLLHVFCVLRFCLTMINYTFGCDLNILDEMRPFESDFCLEAY